MLQKWNLNCQCLSQDFLHIKLTKGICSFKVFSHKQIMHLIYATTMLEIRNFIRLVRCDMQVCLKYSGQRSPVHASAADVKVSLVDDPEGGQKLAFGQRRHVHQVDLSI